MRRHLRLHLTALVSLTLLAIPGLHADVTLRYQSDVTLNPSLPQQITQQAMKSMDTLLAPALIQQFKNGKLFYSSGKQTSIIDFVKQEITLLDNEGKRYATVPAQQFGDEMAHALPEIPAEAKAAIAAMKGHSESTSTGRTATIQGVEAEEREIVMTVDAPPMPNVPAGPMMRMVMHVWMARASEAIRVPAIRELAGYNLFSFAGMNPVANMEKAFQQMPGFADAFSALMKELQSGGTPVFLRMQVETFMPIIGAMLKQMPAGSSNPFGAGFDPDAPLAQVTQELAEISTASIPDSVFQLPEDYRSVPAAEIIKDMLAKAPAAAK